MKQWIEKYAVIMSVIMIGVFTVAAVSFSFHQNLWVDESTQLSGLTLSVPDIYRWLGGLIGNPFPVPSDRMPMLSYLLGVVWSSVFGLDVLPMRWLSLTVVVLGLSFLAFYLIRKKQFTVLFSALLFLCFSPNLMVIAVEIRAYALFFLWAVVAIVLYLSILSSLEKSESIDKKIIALALVLLLAINTHFFGLVLSGAILGSYLLSRMVDARFVLKPKYIITVAIILSVAIAGIVLPVLASFTSQEGSKSSASSISLAIKLIYRLVAHQSMLEVSVLGFGVLPYLAMLLVYGVIAVSLIKRLTLVKVSLALILVLGFLAVFAASLVLSNFDALAPHYNVWMLPVLALLFGYCLVDLPSKVMGLVLVSLVLMLGVGQYTLAISGEKYAHTRFEQIEARVNQYHSEKKVAVLYNKRMAKTWFAGRYRFADQVNQYIVSSAGYADLLADQSITVEQILERNDVLIVAYGQDRYSKELAHAASERALLKTSPVYQQISVPLSNWQVVDSGAYMAQESVDILVYKKTP